MTHLPHSFWPSVHLATMGRPWPPTSADAAKLFIERCSWHALLPLLFAERDLPPALARALDRVAGWRRILEERARLFDGALATLCRALGDEPFALIKGADFAHRLYPSPYLRPMQDIDVLVPSHRLDVACERLTTAGLVLQPRYGAARDPGYNERVFFLGKILVEVHQSFVQVQRHSIDYDALWRRRVSLDVDERRVSRLDDVDALVYLALSMSIDEFRVRLIRYVDLWLLLRQRGGLALEAVERARAWRAARAMYGALSLACRLLPELRTNEVDAAMRAVLPPSTRRLLDRWVLPAATELGSTENLPRARQLWRKALLMDTTRHRVSFFLSHAIAATRYRSRDRGRGFAPGRGK